MLMAVFTLSLCLDQLITFKSHIFLFYFWVITVKAVLLLTNSMKLPSVPTWPHHIWFGI